LSAQPAPPPLPQRLGTALGLNRAAVGHGLRLAGAAWLAFAIATLLHVEHAYWAVMPVWVVAQASRGLLLERAFFRIVGTLAGAAAGFVLIHLPLGPYAVLALLGLWIALASGATHLLRGVHSYGALMAGMTAAIIVLPSIWTPETALAVARARVECTLIGVIVVTLMTGFLTPEAQRQDFYQRARKVGGDAVAHVAQLLQGRDRQRHAEVERRILAGLSSLEDMAPLVSAGSVDGYRRLRHVNALVAAALSTMAAGAALRARADAGTALPAGLPAALLPLAGYLRQPPVPDSAPPPIPALSDKPLQRLRQALQQLLVAAAALGAASANPVAADPRPPLAPQREWQLARRTGLVSGLLSFATAALAYCSGVPEAEQAAVGVCIFSMVLGSMALPQKSAPGQLKGMLCGIAVATGYRLLIQPHITTVPQLLLSLAPFLLLGGLGRASQRFTQPALHANIGFFLASQAALPAAATPGAIWSGSLSLAVVVALVTGSFIWLPRDPRRQAAQAAETVRDDLRRLLARRHDAQADWQARTARQILRLTLHLGRAEELGARLPSGMLAALNLGHAIGDLQHSAHGRPGASRRAARQALALVARGLVLPEANAERLQTLAAAVADPELAATLRDAGAALKDGAALLNYGRGTALTGATENAR